MSRIVSVSLIALAGVASVALAQEPAVKSVPYSPTSAASGQEMYVGYCASCHGMDGKGAGPAAGAFKVPPSDVTTLARRNNGKFPGLHVSAVIQGDSSVVSHGSKEMPVWGPMLHSLSGHDPSEVHLRIANLAKYVESLQVK